MLAPLRHVIGETIQITAIAFGCQKISYKAFLTRTTLNQNSTLSLVSLKLVALPAGELAGRNDF